MGLSVAFSLLGAAEGRQGELCADPDLTRAPVSLSAALALAGLESEG